MFSFIVIEKIEAYNTIGNIKVYTIFQKVGKTSNDFSKL